MTKVSTCNVRVWGGLDDEWNKKVNLIVLSYDNA